MFTETQTKITYLVDGKLDLKRTAKAYAKFYAAHYARIMVINLKRIYHEEISRRLYQEAN